MRPDDWQCTHDLSGFLAHAGGFLRSRPDLHTVALTVTETLRTGGLRAYGDEAPLFGALELGGQVRAAYFRTPPYRLNVTPSPPRRPTPSPPTWSPSGTPSPASSRPARPPRPSPPPGAGTRVAVARSASVNGCTAWAT